MSGGGGKATFNNGLASFERSVSMIPALLASQGFTSTSPAYSVNSYMEGQQYVYGVQLGVTYRFNEHLAVYGGARFNYIWNKYEGYVKDINANINGNMENLNSYFGDLAETYKNMAFYYKMRASEITDETTKAQYNAISSKYSEASKTAEKTRGTFADKQLSCTQEGWGITPVIGVDYKTGKFNFGARLEFTTHLNIENHTKIDDTGLFADGVNTPNDLPGICTIGGQYSILPNVRVMASWHYFFDKDAKMANGKQKLLSGNTQEYLAGAEWDITKNIMVSAGAQHTKYGLGDGSYLSDMSFVTNSYSIGFGAKIKIMKNASVNIAYFWTNYDNFKKSGNEEISGIGINTTDNFTRTNKVLGVGLDMDF